MTLPSLTSTLPGFAGAPAGQLAELLARPGTVHSVNRPVVSLTDGRCLGYQASVRMAERAVGSAGPWFQAAAESGLGGQFGALALQTALRERATLPGERFLAVELTPDSLGHREVLDVLAAEDDVADLMITLIPAGVPAAAGSSSGGSASAVAVAALDGFRIRGLLLAVPVGLAGLADLLAVERLSPDLVLLPAGLVRGVHLELLQRRLIDVVVQLADAIGAATLAEEVESLDEARVLRSAGVKMAQGWLFGRPRPGFVPPSPEVCEWLGHRS